MKIKSLVFVLSAGVMASSALGSSSPLTVDFSEIQPLNSVKVTTGDDSAKKLVVFWATWCGSCKEKLTTTLPHWKKTKNMDIITVSIDQNPERAKHFIDKYKINLPAFIDHKEFYQKNLKVQSVPYWAVFQKDKVSAKWMMTDDGKGFDEKEILVKMKPGPQKVI